MLFNSILKIKNISKLNLPRRYQSPPAQSKITVRNKPSSGSFEGLSLYLLSALPLLVLCVGANDTNIRKTDKPINQINPNLKTSFADWKSKKLSKINPYKYPTKPKTRTVTKADKINIKILKELDAIPFPTNNTTNKQTTYSMLIGKYMRYSH